MNYLAGFLIVIVADSVMSGRQDSSGDDRANGSTGTAATASLTSAALAAANGGGGGGGSRWSEAHHNGVSTKHTASRGGDAGVDPTAEETELIERECVQAMLGMVALQGGVLSRDLWGLHAVSSRALFWGEIVGLMILSVVLCMCDCVLSFVL